MVETTGRLLALLAALQSRPSWTVPNWPAARGDGAHGAPRRRSVAPAGLSASSPSRAPTVAIAWAGRSAVPPLMLDADEVFALAALARAADRQSLGEAAQRAVGKLEQTLPASLHTDVALTSTSVIPSLPRPATNVDSRVLRTVERRLPRLRRARGALPRPQRRPSPSAACCPTASSASAVAGTSSPATPGSRSGARGVSTASSRPFRPDTGSWSRSARCGELVQRSISTAPYRYQATRRARCPDRVDRRARCRRASPCSKRSTSTPRCSPPAPTNSTRSCSTSRCSTWTSACVEPAALRERMHAVSGRLSRC